MMQLRPYQSTALAAIQDAYWSGRKAPLLCAPTGSGKSAMTAYMLARTRKRTLYLCHRAELMDMICADLKAAGIPHGRVEPGKPILRHSHQIFVGMVQTVTRRLDDLPAFEWIISDEAHLAMAAEWLSILRYFSDVWHLGMSATPCRLDGKGLGQFYDQIVYGPSVAELTARGYLSPCRVFAPAQNVSSLRKRAGEYSMDEAAALLDRAAITGDAIKEYRRHKDGKRAIVFCCTRQHADHVAAQFRADGIAAVNVDGAMPKGERAERIADLWAGRINVLTNVDLLTTGFDMPSIEAEIMLRPTQSLALYLQMVGRVLRVAPGKDGAVLLDHVGNVFRHGLPADEREWTLDGQAKRERNAAAVRQCPQCYAAFLPAPKCPECGYVFPVEKRETARTQKDGELVEIGRTDIDARTQHLRDAPLKDLLKGARTREALEEIREARGYSHGWVRKMLEFKAGARARAIGASYEGKVA